jgi:ABC-2 type transport system ATP-binding protein
MKQRLMLARSLVNQPQILFRMNDRWSSICFVGDHSRHHSYRSEQGTTVFLTTHDMVEADNLAHRVAFIEKGQDRCTGYTARVEAALRQTRAQVEIECPDGRVETTEVILDREDTSQMIAHLFAQERVVTVTAKKRRWKTSLFA